MKLVIVESPTKAKTISKFLGGKFTVKSSYGHIRDLPTKKMGIDIEHDFEPEYEIPTKNIDRVKELKKLAKKADGVILATDEDREGEAISWHLVAALGLKIEETERIAFHEITKKAIEEALKNPRKIDYNLVDAQQARRVLDRLVGYELSPFLWKKIRRGLSAGRVQSVALRLIVEKEREIQNFKSEEYWAIAAQLKSQKTNSLPTGQAGKSQTFEAKLSKENGTAIGKLGIKNKEQADKIVGFLEKAAYQITSITKKEVQKNPLAPYTTSTLDKIPTINWAIAPSRP
jgi:DNA topoisomerase-1